MGNVRYFRHRRTARVQQAGRFRVSFLVFSVCFQTVGFYLKDKAKKMALSLALMTPIMSVVIFIVKLGGDYFFLYIWVFMSIIIFVSATVVSFLRILIFSIDFSSCSLSIQSSSPLSSTSTHRCLKAFYARRSKRWPAKSISH